MPKRQNHLKLIHRSRQNNKDDIMLPGGEQKMRKATRMEKFRGEAKEKIHAYEGPRIVCIDVAALNSAAVDNKGNKLHYLSVCGKPRDTDPKSDIMRELNGVIETDGHVYSQEAIANEMLLSQLIRPSKREKELENDLLVQSRLVRYGLAKIGKDGENPIQSGEGIYLVVLTPASFSLDYRQRFENMFLDIKEVLGKKVNILGVKSYPESFAVAKGNGVGLFSLIVDGGHRTTDIAAIIGGNEPLDDLQKSHEMGGYDVTKLVAQYVNRAIENNNYTAADANLSDDEYRAIKEEFLKAGLEAGEEIRGNIKVGVVSPRFNLTEIVKAQEQYLEDLVDPMNQILGRVQRKYQEKVAENVYITGGALMPERSATVLRNKFNGKRLGIELGEIGLIEDNIFGAALGGLYNAVDAISKLGAPEDLDWRMAQHR